MKGQSVGALAASIIAVALAIAALVLSSGSKAREAPRERTTARDFGSLEADVASLKATAASTSVEVGRISKIEDGLADLAARMAKLERSRAEKKQQPAPVVIDDNTVRDAVQAYFRQRTAEMRAGRRGGAANRGGQRVELAAISEPVKQAALKAADGFEIDHAHDGGKTDDGKAIYDIDGRAGGQRYRVRVTAEGQVIESGPRERRGRGARGGRPRPGGAEAPTPAEPEGDAAF